MFYKKYLKLFKLLKETMLIKILRLFKNKLKSLLKLLFLLTSKFILIFNINFSHFSMRVFLFKLKPLFKNVFIKEVSYFIKYIEKNKLIIL